MSPEQADSGGSDVDTRSDVYSPGVLLYELLAGVPPLEERTLRNGGYAEVLRVIREVEPPRPSRRVSGLGASVTEIAARRKLEPAQLPRALRGDLDWIVMKALEKDRERRFASPEALLADIGRMLKAQIKLARVWLRSGRSDEAQEALLKLAERGWTRHGLAPGDAMDLYYKIGANFYQKGDMAAALPWYEERLALALEAYGSENIATLLAKRDLGEVLSGNGRHGEAEVLLREAIAALEKTVAPDSGMLKLARTYLEACLQGKQP